MHSEDMRILGKSQKHPKEVKSVKNCLTNLLLEAGNCDDDILALPLKRASELGRQR